MSKPAKTPIVPASPSRPREHPTAINQLPAIQTEPDVLAAIDRHIANHCREMGQTFDPLNLTRLRAEVLEYQRRKETVKNLFGKVRKRDQQLKAIFFLYKKGVEIKDRATIEMAAQMEGWHVPSLSYEQFVMLMLNKDKLTIAKQVAEKVHAHNKKQQVVQIASHQSRVDQRVETARRRFNNTTW